VSATWPVWGSFWFGVLCAYVVPWVAIVSVVAVACALRDVRARWRQRAAIDALLRESRPHAMRGTW
jgi:hypothetical protein